jgi:hypothetical protein
MDPIHDVYPRGSSSTLSASYATEGSRESALAVTHAVQYHLHRRIDLPPGASVARTAGPFDVKSKPLDAARHLRVTPGSQSSAAAVEDDLTLEIPTGTVSAAAYAGFVSDAHRTDDAFLAATRVKVPRGGP